MTDEIEASEVVSDPAGTEVSSTPAINEAWTPLLEMLPDAYKGAVTPILQQWDRGVQQRFDENSAKTKPYQSFIDGSVDPQLLNVGLSLVEQLRSNPQKFYADLGDRLGITAQQAQEVVEQASADDDAYEDPRLATVMQQQEELRNYILQQQEAQQQERANAKANADVDALVQKYDIPRGPVLASVINRAIHKTNGDLEAAYQEEMQYHQYLAQTNPNISAPRVLSGSGTSGATPQKSVNDLKGDERVSALADAIRRLS